jgi:hypothetical protein
VRKNTEESLAARIATVGVKAQEAFREEKCALLNALTGNTLEIEVSTLWAVREPCEGEGHTMTVKTALASMAAPGFKPRKPEEEVHYPAAMRAIAVRATALRANHRIDHL